MKQKGNILYFILFGLLMVFLFLGLVQQQFHVFSFKELSGVTVKTEKPELSLESYVSRKYQSQTEKYISENFGFREPVIRVYNQYVWTFFNKTYCHFIKPGKDGYLYYSGAVNDYYGIEHLKHYKTNADAVKHVEKQVRMMNKLRYVLKDYDVEFLAFMAPDKAYVYPEYLPRRDARDPEAVNMMECFDERLTAVGFPHVEMTKWYKTMKGNVPFMLFPKTDSHWRFSAIYGYDSLFCYMNSLNDFGIPDIRINGLTAIDTSYRENDELTLNLIFPIRDQNQHYKAEISVECGENCHKPKVLWVGDSFIWDLEAYLPWRQILEDVEIWFYNSSSFTGFEKEKGNVKETNRLRKILNNDFVVWYSTAHQWSLATYGFVEDALLQLCVSDSLFEAQIPWVMDSLRTDAGFARKHPKLVDCEGYNDSLRFYAIKTLEKDPELIPGLNGEEMPVIRNTEAIRLAQQENAISNDKGWMMRLRLAASSQERLVEEILMDEAKNVLEGRPLICQEYVIDTAAILQMEQEKLMLRWRNNAESVKFLEDKAKEKGKPFEVVLEEDAKWVVNQRLQNGELF